MILEFVVGTCVLSALLEIIRENCQYLCSHRPLLSLRCVHTKLLVGSGCNVPWLVDIVHDKQQCPGLSFPQIPKWERYHKKSDENISSLSCYCRYFNQNLKSWIARGPLSTWQCVTTKDKLNEDVMWAKRNIPLSLVHLTTWCLKQEVRTFLP